MNLIATQKEFEFYLVRRRGNLKEDQFDDEHTLVYGKLISERFQLQGRMQECEEKRFFQDCKNQFKFKDEHNLVRTRMYGELKL